VSNLYLCLVDALGSGMSEQQSSAGGASGMRSETSSVGA
jgi:hypothetical protein